ncbi:hypothetical protein B0H16DRAFT_465554 [Mycena metata]|uniref:Uncharacterized protein n=1 Tax=Mycena metata TaxID=1033252 RepID=A0AAD7KC63_9AGAR|nr:hypothetical protein B0H16DRAFT_465554 [Mycena metata]
MDATALVNLPRSRIVGLAKAHKIKANLSTKEIIRQLLVLFPKGVPSVPSILDDSAAGLVEKVKGPFKAFGRAGSRAASLTPEAPVNANCKPADSDTGPSGRSMVALRASGNLLRLGSRGLPRSRILIPRISSCCLRGKCKTTSIPPPRINRGAPPWSRPEIGNDSPYARPNRPNEDQPGSLSMAPTLIVGNNSPYAHAGTTNLLRPPSPHINPIDSRGSFKSASLHSDDEEEDYYDDEDDDEDPGLSGHAANPEDVRRLIQDMATISARNKRYIH